MSQLPPTLPQQPQVRQFQPQQIPGGQFQPQQIPVGQFQPQQPQLGQFQPQYPFPPNEQRGRRPWYKKQGVIIGLICSLILFVALLSYGITTVLENGQAPTPAATVTPSSQLAAASPTAVPTLVPSPASTLAPTPTPKVQVTPTVVLTATPTPVPTATSTPKPMIVNVKVYNSGFSPAMITISVGSTVIWTNDGAIAHTVTDNNKAFDSGNLASGATFQFTFLKRGTYHYVCTYHPFMVGTIIVK